MKIVRFMVLLATLSFIALQASAAEPNAVRTWTAVKGATIEARFVRQAGSSVILKTEAGKQTMIRLSALSKADQDYIKETAAAKRASVLGSRSAVRPAKTPEPDSTRITADYLTRVECEVIEEMNLARTDPQGYMKHVEAVRDSHLGNGVFKTSRGRLKTQEGLKAVDEAIEFLKTAKPVPPLKPSNGLSRAAKVHAKDIGPAGVTGHDGTDGSTSKSRIDAQGKWKRTIGENIAFGPNTARAIVVQLIIDDGVPSRGHRENIYKKEFLVAGIAIGPHKRYGTMCVIDYAGGFSD